MSKEDASIGHLLALFHDNFHHILGQKSVKADNKAGYTATPVVCGWAGAEIEVTRSFGQEQ